MEDIAVIGFSFQLPSDARDEAAFWRILETKRNLSSRWPSDRVNIDGFYDPDGTRANSLSSQTGHFINADLSAFDAPFFSITAKEAAAMDPQHRLALETTYRAFENAGLPMETLRGSRTAVFGASMSDDYARMHAKDPDTAPRMVIVGTPPSLLANRISYHFNLTGPSVHIDTACSSSTIAVDLACQSMHFGDATLAVVTGANLLLGPEDSVLMSSLGFLSKDGVCYSFDHRATGYGRGEGVISMILKPVSAAVRNGDMIRAVIRGTGSNQDGRTSVLPQPNPISQEDLIRHVYHKAGLGLELTRYFEAHGTGTGVGDPLEMKAIGNAFKAVRSSDKPLFVGSVKANIGHLEAASGLAAIIKTIMVLEKGVIAPNALFEKVNPDIALEHGNILVPTHCIPWPVEGPRRASVSSFGFGGSNCHIILDDAFHYLQALGLRGNHNTVTSTVCGQINTTCIGAVNLYDASSSNPVMEDSQAGEESMLSGASKQVLGRSLSLPQLLVWSAATDPTLRNWVKQHEEQLHNSIWSQKRLECMSYTLAKRRSRMAWRTFAVVDVNSMNSQEKLAAYQPVRSSTTTPVTFVFTGQGAQYYNMGEELLQFRVFETSLRQIDTVLKDLGCEWSLFDELRNSENIDKPQYSQPLCTALQIALVELLQSCSIRPTVVLGHSSGEIAAAYTAGALSLKSACKVAYFRGKVAATLQQTEKGAMAAVNLPESDVVGYIRRLKFAESDSGLHVACINSPSNITLSGPEYSIDLLLKLLETDGIFARKLKVDVAYHSPAIQKVAAAYSALIGTLEAGESSGSLVSMISSVTGRLIATSELLNPNYWIENMASKVRFSEALRQAVPDGVPKLSRGVSTTMANIIEIGPHSALRRPIKETLHRSHGGQGGPGITYSPVLVRKQSSARTFLAVLGELFCHGHDFNIPLELSRSSEDSRENIQLITDCPEYPFDHSRKYWAESRLSRDYRLRTKRPSNLLGNHFYDWNPLQPRWRNIPSLVSLPWLRDHEVSGTKVYPATAMLVMAIEALKETASTGRQIVGYYIKDAQFMSPISIHEDPEDTTETMLQVRPVRQSFEKESGWYEIQIHAYVADRWSEAFWSMIQVQFLESIDEVDGGKEADLTNDKILKEYQAAVDSCRIPIDHEEFYDFCRQHGHNYGKSFRILEDIHWDGDEVTVGRIDTAAVSHRSADIVHPTVLDAALHIFLVQSSLGMTQPTPTFVPRRVTNAWLSASSGWKYPETSAIRLSMRTRYKPSKGGLEGTAFAIDDDGRPLWTLPTVELFSVSVNSLPLRQNNGNAIYHINYRPHIGLLEKEQLEQICNMGRHARDGSFMSHYFRKLSYLIDVILRKTSREMCEERHRHVPPFLTRYVSWMNAVTEQHPQELSSEIDALLDSQNDERIEGLLAEVESLHPPWQMFPTIARNLSGILCGDIDPLELVFSTGLAESVYAEQFDGICDERLDRLLGLLSHENPNMRILEVGAGTGRLTKHILSSLHREEERTGTTRFAEYAYTDLSPAFLARAADEFTDDRLSFKVLDLEHDLLEQGVCHSYDLVIAGSVLHATRRITDSLSNIQKVLVRPGGRLIFLEMVAPEKTITNFGFGVFPGWWVCEEDWRGPSPAINEHSWDTVLKETGYTGMDLCFRDYEGEESHLISIIVTTATEELPTRVVNGGAPRSVLLVINEDSQQQAALASSIRQCIPKDTGWNCEVMSLRQLAERDDLTNSDIAVTLLEIGSAFLSALSLSAFDCLQRVMAKLQNLLWISSTNRKSDVCPDFGLGTGFLRSMRLQAFETKVVSLAIEYETEPLSTAESLQCILKVLYKSFRARSIDHEFVHRQGITTSARMVENKSVSTASRSLIHPQTQMSPWLSGPALKLSMASPGVLDSFEFVADRDFHEAPLQPYEIEFEAKTWGLSFRDLFIALGRLEETQFGYDCAGIVTRVGAACDARFRPGDRVFAGALGCMRTFPRAHVDSVGKVPDDLPLEICTSILSPGVTAYYSLVHVARLRRGEKVLIHSAAGSTGQMAIWIARMLGAEIFATVSNNSKKRLLVEQFGIHADNIFYSRNSSFAQGVMRATSGYGMDVVLNSLAGDSLRSSWECMAPYGRFIEIGKADIMADSPLPMSGFKKNVSFSAVDIFHLATANPGLAAELITAVVDLARRNVIQHPHPLHLYPVSRVEDAFRYFQSGKNTGRIIITIDHNDLVQKRFLNRQTWSFDPNASYIVAGGFGGLGRAVISWMAKRGAKHLIVLSRSGSRSNAAKEVLSELRSDIKLFAPSCDVGDFASVSAVMADCAARMPPVKGCINAAMVLQDAVFQNMTLPQWELTIRSKVHTSWNLHRLLSQDLDFFILFSSLSGIYGTVAQSNYSAGCTFQDALARYRVARGLKAVSFDIGWMRNIGIIAETEDYQRRRETEANMAQVDDQELIALLELYCDPKCPLVSSEDEAQLLLGAITPAMLRAHGQEVPFSVEQPLFSGFSQLRGDQERGGDDLGPDSAQHQDSVTLFKTATAPGERVEVVTSSLRSKIARALFTSIDDIDSDKTLSDYGVDSLLAVELRNAIHKDFQANVAVFDIMGGSSILKVGELVVERSELATH